MCHNCFMLNYELDRIADRLIEEKLGIITIRQKFPSDTVWIVTYKQGKKLTEGFED